MIFKVSEDARRKEQGRRIIKESERMKKARKSDNKEVA